MNKSQYQNVFSTPLQPKNASVSPFGPFYYRPKWPISVTFHVPQLVKSKLFHIPEAWKRYPFRAEPPHIGLIRSTSPPRTKTSLTFSLNKKIGIKFPRCIQSSIFTQACVEFIIWNCDIFWISSNVNILARCFLVYTFWYSLIRKVCLNKAGAW